MGNIEISLEEFDDLSSQLDHLSGICCNCIHSHLYFCTRAHFWAGQLRFGQLCASIILCLYFQEYFFFIGICICVCICIRVFGQERILLRRVGGMVGMGAVMTCGPAHDLHPSQCARVQPLFHICAHSLNVFLRPCNCICQGSISLMYCRIPQFSVYS